MSRKENEQNKDLDTLVKDLKQLQIQVNIVKRQIENLRSERNGKESTTSNRKKTLKVGDTVVVMGSYRNRKGVTGKVVKITPAQIQLRPDSGKDKFQIYKQNVKLI
jgi:preprotein translocase subunit YajC